MASEVREQVLQEQLDEQVNTLNRALLTRAHDPNTDSRTRLFNIETVAAITKKPFVRSALENVITAQPGRDTNFLIEFLPRAIRAIAHEYDTDDIADYDKPGIWLSKWDLLENHTAYDKFYLNAGRPIQSNIGERAKIPHFLFTLLGITDPINALEYGSSDSHIGKMLALRSEPEFAYSPTDVMDRRYIRGSLELVRNDRVSRMFQELLERPFELNRYTGLDVWSPHDPAVKAWIEVCSSYLSEVGDTEKVERFKALQQAKPENVAFCFADFTAFDSETYAGKVSGKDKPNLIIISFSTYLLKKEEQEKTLRQAAETVDKNEKNSIVVVLDDVASIDGFRPEIVPRKYDYSTCGAWVYDNWRPEDGYQKFLSVKSGRCEGVIMESALGGVAVRHALNPRS